MGTEGLFDPKDDIENFFHGKPSTPGVGVAWLIEAHR